MSSSASAQNNNSSQSPLITVTSSSEPPVPALPAAATLSSDAGIGSGSSSGSSTSNSHSHSVVAPRPVVRSVFPFQRRPNANKKPRYYAEPAKDSKTHFENLTASMLWTHVVMPFLNSPKSLIRVASINPALRQLASEDRYWEPFVGKIAEGYFLKELRERNALAPLGKTLKHAFMAATVHRCTYCETQAQYGRFLQPFTLRRICYDCYDSRCKANDPDFRLMNKTRAREDYLLSEKDIKQLCNITVGDPSRFMEGSILVSRKQAEELACAKYPNGMAGLLEEKAKRQGKAQKRFNAAMKAYEAKLKLRNKAGAGDSTPMPKRPKRSPLLKAEINPDRDGYFAVAYRNAALLDTIGFPSADTGENTGDGLVYCRLCSEKEPSKPEFKWMCFPSFDDLYSEHHMVDCPYFEDEDDDFCGCG